jgi:hypothetical protein
LYDNRRHVLYERYAVSANASETKSAKLLAVFVVDTNETEEQRENIWSA